MLVRTCVDADLHAFHTDPINDPSINEGRHEHVWNVQLVVEHELPEGSTLQDVGPLLDGRCLRAALIGFLRIYDGQDLPWWSGEEIAAACLTIGTADPIGCIVTRPGYRAEVWR